MEHLKQYTDGDGLIENGGFPIKLTRLDRHRRNAYTGSLYLAALRATGDGRQLGEPSTQGVRRS